MKKIAQIILAVAIVALVYVIYDQISTPIKFDDELKAKKARSSTASRTSVRHSAHSSRSTSVSRAVSTR